MGKGLMAAALLIVVVIILASFGQMNTKDKDPEQTYSYTPPKNGFIFSRGGLRGINSWYAFEVDLDAGTIKKFEDPEEEDDGVQKFIGIQNLSAEEITKMRELAQRAIQEDKKRMVPDLDFKLVLSLDGVVSSTETYGALPDEGALNDLFEMLWPKFVNN
jgi:hypothetical protein